VSPRLEEIWIYPLKGAAGIRVSRWEVGPLGLVHDRRWMLVDEQGRFRSQRTDPLLCRVIPTIGDGELRLEAPGVPPLVLPLSPNTGRSQTARIWSDEVEARVPSEDAGRWFTEFLGATCRLVFLPEQAARACDPRRARGSLVALADAFPFLLTSVESLADLNAKLDSPVPMNRFRPNLVVSAGAPYAEDAWTSFRIGNIPFHAVKPCTRCVVTTVDQATAVKGREPLRTLASYRSGHGGVIFGQNLVHLARGTICAREAIEETKEDGERAEDG
jgi:uncharacterized protein YcbX